MGETLILVWFYAIDCLGCFYVLEGKSMDFMFFMDYIAHPRCMGLKSLGSLGVSYGVDYFFRKPKFWFGFMLSIVLVVFGSGMIGL